MIAYDKSQPLIIIHIPKTAGVTIKEVYKQWFGERLLFHYCDWSKGKLPEKHELFDGIQREPLLVYGHFNRVRNFGIEQYYPDVNQFVTILRDPLEQAISGFFYVRKTSPNWRDILGLPKGGLCEYIENLQSGVLDYFPQKVTFMNYQAMFEEQFVEVGVTEYLDESMKRIANKLGQNYTPGLLGRLNRTKRDQKVSEGIKERFIERHKLDYVVYNYVLDKYR